VIVPVRRQFRVYGLLNDLFSVLRLDMYGTAAQKQRGSEYSKIFMTDRFE